MADDQPGLFQPVQRGIDRALRQIESTLTALADLLDDGISIARAAFDDRKQDGIKVALQHLRIHGTPITQLQTIIIR